MYRCVLIDKKSLIPERVCEMNYTQSSMVMFMCSNETWKTIPETDIAYLETHLYYFVRLEYYAELDTCLDYFITQKEERNEQ